MDQDNVNLLRAFTSFDGFQATMNELLPVLQHTNSASAALLALEGLYRIEADVGSGQFSVKPVIHEKIRDLLRKWRCESPLDGAYRGAFDKLVPFLRSLTIFQILEVPLFIDNYGKKRLMKQYGNVVEPILITLETPIVHVTHEVQKDQIVANGFKPSNNKNIIEGIWFSPKYQLGDPPTSVYGNWAFETTLKKLSGQIRGIRQGEIVAYKQEVNFIVYAGDTASQSLVVKATENATKLSQEDPNAYAAVSIFVPSRFLPQHGVPKAAFGEPYYVYHRPFCVQEKRKVLPSCGDLLCNPSIR